MTVKSKIIVISGIDGSGKTSSINALQEMLKNKGIKSKYVWLRYNHYLTKFVLAFSKCIGLTKYEYFDNSRVVYHNFYKSKIVSWLFIWFTYIDTLLVSIFKVYIPSKLKSEYIIIDRWVFDIMIDLEIDTRMDFSRNSFFSKLFKSLLPSSANCFLIQRNSNTVRVERDESINDRSFFQRYSLYDYHSSDLVLEPIDNNNKLTETISQIEKKLNL